MSRCVCKMVDKRYVRGCGGKCLRCWRNRLKHANPNADLSKGLEVTGETWFEWTEVPEKPLRTNSRAGRRQAARPELTAKQEEYMRHRRCSRNEAPTRYYTIPRRRLVEHSAD